ncbi:aspartate aminotransferase family protein [Rhizobium leucaenae]|uniref:Glutamate-1-semialdehyde 2,1-aminomutase n=1 Tax=Rhizobium leucaenae TaxID=29450 RepID=A0A7W7EPD8_9HYPH|nr:aspartate aminotransferase family protein [Rhizobium leucaenae]MBB4571143.1 glutamate-1-semialdehyde 2,1-aminomutase [Rhizobium leucaenae]MBB6304124.1 glutamate-1-semialdehyde 2,1-aminomutase [Rhizobium leucaenae]
MLHQDFLSFRRAARRSRSQYFFERGRLIFPDGTTRVTVERDPIPTYIARGEGAYLIDVDGNRLLDLNNNFTTLIHGHGYLPVADAVADILQKGTCFSNPTEHELGLAELLVQRIPAIEHIRFVNSGTEAVMFAIKAARAFTGRSRIARAEGAYHGAYDWAEVSQSAAPASWGPEEAPTATTVYRGAPESVAEEVDVIRFNDIEGLERRVAISGSELACILIDPMPSRAGLTAPDPAFVEAISTLSRQYGFLVVADEVLNLRQGYRGASARFGLVPDLVAAGKIIGGGFPVGAVGGRKEVMEVFAGVGTRPVLPQGGTFSANPVSMVAGRVAMEALTPASFERLEEMGTHVRNGLCAAIARYEAPFSVTGSASLFRIHPKRHTPREYRQAFPTPEQNSWMTNMTSHFRSLDILLPFGAASCLSTAMTNSDLDLIVEAFGDFLETYQSAFEELKA